ncbi:RUS1 family protein [archaeon]|nr:MAG: RUS1 family protein [archaeon]
MVVLQDIDDVDGLIGTYHIDLQKNRVDCTCAAASPSLLFSFNLWQSHVYQVLFHTFLPTGYPHSVRPEYLSYQCWDALQGLSSYLRAVLTTKSLLAGVGVGSSTATPLSAAMTWVIRDGCGMLGGLLLAYSYSHSFEMYTKEWRLCADFLNNLGLTLDLLSCIDHARYYVLIVILSTLCKAGCGLIAGATKTRISAHFALKGQVADISAKESTQETAVALLGLGFGMVLAHIVGENNLLIWTAFILLLCLHQYANYRLVKVLIFHTLNPQRAILLTKRLIDYDHSHPHRQPHDGAYRFATECYGDVRINPTEIAGDESVLAPFTLSFTAPRIGVSLRELADCMNSQDNAADVMDAWQGESFLIAVSSSGTVPGRVLVSLQEHTGDQEIMRAYMIGCYIYVKLQLREVTAEEASMKELAVEAKQWTAAHWHAIGMHGWDIEDAGSLGVGRYRYSVKKSE